MNFIKEFFKKITHTYGLKTKTKTNTFAIAWFYVFYTFKNWGYWLGIILIPFGFVFGIYLGQIALVNNPPDVVKDLFANTAPLTLAGIILFTTFFVITPIVNDVKKTSLPKRIALTPTTKNQYIGVNLIFYSCLLMVSMVSGIIILLAFVLSKHASNAGMILFNGQTAYLLIDFVYFFILGAALHYGSVVLFNQTFMIIVGRFILLVIILAIFGLPWLIPLYTHKTPYEFFSWYYMTHYMLPNTTLSDILIQSLLAGFLLIGCVGGVYYLHKTRFNWDL